MLPRFIVIDGIDGSGKTSQCKLLEKELKKTEHCVSIRDPGSTKIAEDIRKILLNLENEKITPKTELFLYSACRNQLLENIIIPALNDNKIVICDRYISSTIAYQSVNNFDYETIFYTFEKIGSCVWPSITFILDLDPEVAMERAFKRGNLTRFEKRGIKYMKEVANKFRNYEQIKGGRNKNPVFVLDINNLTQEQTHQEIMNILHSI